METFDHCYVTPTSCRHDGWNLVFLEAKFWWIMFLQGPYLRSEIMPDQKQKFLQRYQQQQQGHSAASLLTGTQIPQLTSSQMSLVLSLNGNQRGSHNF
jgi:hypothetical protein